MNIKKIITVIALACITQLLSAQSNIEGVSIAPNVTPPDPSAMLDVLSSTKGILIPRVTLLDITNPAPIVNPAVSLLVYNNAPIINGGCGPGYYFWTGSVWEKLGRQCIPHMTFAQMIALTSSMGAADIGYQVYVTDPTVSPSDALGFTCTTTPPTNVAVQGIWTFVGPQTCLYGHSTTLQWSRQIPIIVPACIEQADC